MLWDEIEPVWQEVFNLAWTAYRTGSIPAGAVIVNEDGNIISRGNNRVFEKKNIPAQISNHSLAHAEINAILQINEENHPSIRNYALYTSTEPCHFCLNAIVFGEIKNVKYAARDIDGNATALIYQLDYIKSRNILFEGPHKDLEKIQIAIQSCYGLELNFNRFIKSFNEDYNIERLKLLFNRQIRIWERNRPNGTDLAIHLFNGNILQSFKEKNTPMSEVWNHIMNIKLKHSISEQCIV